MERRHALLPICSGVLGVLCAALQLVAIATPHWAEFWSSDPLGTGGVRPEQNMEAGYYGLWKICLTSYENTRLEEVKCDLLDTRFNPGKFRYITGAFAVGNFVLLLVFLTPIPAQLVFLLKEKGILPVSFIALTTIKIVTSTVGGAAAIAASIIINFQRTNETFQEKKGWSFGIQIVVVILEVFLIICSSAEHIVGRTYPKGPLTRCLQMRNLSAMSNLGFNNKSSDSLSHKIQTPSSNYDMEVEPMKMNNDRTTTRESSIISDDEMIETKVALKQNHSKYPNKTKEAKEKKNESEKSSDMRFSNPVWKSSVESELDDSVDVFTPNKVTPKSTYYFGNSNSTSAKTFNSGKSEGNLSTLTARSTDV